ncbi:cytochrome c biogenesis heme-transporting ATPase CcmA [Gallaecimonas pentaromativorans]|uniref:Heme exporter protein A n=1 Tax=Gallaecimonas pentaromativorans TaxID=584787 RepID=A0A3N1P4H8_9GAMM|nr:cytochrome c biogenesis heme-transporting ATPase CcmA [Gallaecimonas pentaromativorans]MED5526659.1 cytochrome c biogenesis heme-transporting ATPase CcmA [Pseudomonadota bacterium]ROQ22558.1 heme exporter protein A [Gallaecimonas pentaromativorans]
MTLVSYPLISVENLSCIREERTLFASLSFDLEAGELIQVEGPNGAGKSSLLAIVAGLGDSATGKVCYLNQAIGEVRAQYHQDLLFIGHHSGINTVLTPLENLAFYARIQPCQPLDHWQVLDTVGLFGFEDVPVGQLSAGQQRRVALARLWLSRARVWVLDEPFTAIDKKGVAALEQRLWQHCQQGGAVLMTSHQDLAKPPSQRLLLEAVS